MITIVCPDAGGSEILSNWLLNQKEEYNLVVDGPAEEIFEVHRIASSKKKGARIIFTFSNMHLTSRLI